MARLEKFEVSIGNICVMSCISDILNYYNLSLSESDVFSFTEAQLFYYKPISVEELESFHGEVPLLSVTMGGMKYDIKDMLSCIENTFQIKTEFQYGYDKEEIKDFIVDNIDNRIPVMSLLSRYHLDYIDDKIRDNITHSINITGYDWKKNILYIGDTYLPTIPVKNYIGAVSFESYYNSLIMSKDIFNKQFLYRNIAIDGKNAVNFENLTWKQKIKPLKSIAEHYYKSEQLEGGVLTGQKAYEAFFCSVEEWMQSDSKEELFRIVHHRLTNYGGLVLTYSLLLDYVRRLSNGRMNERMKDIQNQFLMLIKEWKIIANMFLKVSVASYEDIKKNMLGRIANKIAKTLVEEEKLYAMLKALS